jgi:DNA-binding NtrC family response regulator
VNSNPTILVLHEHAGVVELIEAALRDRGFRVLGTLDALEAAEIVGRLKFDLLVISRGHLAAAESVPALQTGLPAVVLNVEPMGLDEIVDAVVTALPQRRERS